MNKFLLQSQKSTLIKFKIKNKKVKTKIDITQKV